MADVSAEAEKRLRAAFAVFDVDGSGSLSVEELRVVLSRPTPGGSPMSDEEIQALIDEFDEDGDGEMQYEEFAKMWSPMVVADGGMSEDGVSVADPQTISSSANSPTASFKQDHVSFKKGGASFKNGVAAAIGSIGASFKRKKPRTVQSAGSKSVLSFISGPGERNATSDVGSSSSSNTKVAGGRSKASIDEFASLQSAAELRRLAKEQEVKGEELQDNAPNTALGAGSLEARLGLAMISYKLAAGASQKPGSHRLEFQDLVRLWDRDGDGTLNLIEFRQAVRSPELSVSATNSEIDSMFKSFDRDSSGTIDTKELKLSLAALQDAASAAKAQSEAELARADLCLQRARLLRTAEATMVSVEAREKEVRRIESGHSTELRIGIALRRKRMKLEQLIRQWPGAQAGYASRAAIEEGVHSFLNVQAIDDLQLGTWFNRCYQAGLAASVCRPPVEGLPSQISLKHDLPPLLAAAKKELALALERESALKESKRAALAEQEAIRLAAKALNKEWAAQGAAALKAAAERAAAEAETEALQAKRDAARQRTAVRERKERRQSFDGRRGSATGNGEEEIALQNALTAAEAPRKVYNVKVKEGMPPQQGTPRQGTPRKSTPRKSKEAGMAPSPAQRHRRSEGTPRRSQATDDAQRGLGQAAEETPQSAQAAKAMLRSDADGQTVEHDHVEQKTLQWVQAMGPMEA